MVEDTLVEIFLEQGVKISDRRIPKVKEELHKSIDENRFKFITKGNKDIGFYAWQEREDCVFINNMCILKEYQNRTNLLYLREFFREKYPNKCLAWKNRRTGQWRYRQ